MAARNPGERFNAVDAPNSANLIDEFCQALETELAKIRRRAFSPTATKQFSRTFSTLDVSRLLGIPESSIKALSIDGNERGPQPSRLDNGRRAYTLEQVWELRGFLAENRPSDALRLRPWRRNGEHLQVIACSNFKGGSSKTTTSLNLAHFLGLQGYRVLCIDLDPQASLTSAFGIESEFDIEENSSAYGFLRYGAERVPLTNIILPTYFTGIDLVPGRLEMMEFETETPAALMSRVQDGGGMFFERMAIGLREQAIQDNYDVVILDTPPSLGYITLSCLYAATGVVITTQAAMMDFASVSQWLRMLSGIHSNIKDAGATLNHDFIRFLLTRFNPNDSPQKMLAGVLRSCLGDYVLTHEALESTAIQAAGFAKRTIYELEPGSVGRDPLRRAQESIDGVNQEILDLISKAWGRK